MEQQPPDGLLLIARIREDAPLAKPKTPLETLIIPSTFQKYTSGYAANRAGYNASLCTDPPEIYLVSVSVGMIAGSQVSGHHLTKKTVNFINSPNRHGVIFYDFHGT